MLWTIFVILLVLWLFGLVSAYTLGGFIHLLLLIAVIVLVVQLMQVCLGEAETCLTLSSSSITRAQLRATPPECNDRRE